MPTEIKLPALSESINEGALRVHLTRLRRRVRSLGLEIQNVRGRGYLMEQAAG